ncbi:MAG TPA: hypothetical protein VGC13_16960 [Longimicrobium sp.]|jgi:hypothetical protein|uniref:T4SS efffector SepA family protein n=1 Tax=Longimicrobium sp. TaxID=2029185 RepID=UPI002ED87542
MPQVEISDATYVKLQQLGVAFVDTPETVIARLADAALASQRAGGNGAPVRDPVFSGIELDVFSPGNLAFTRVRRASFAGREIDRPRWNKLLRVAHIEAFRKLGSFSALSESSNARLRQGSYVNEGFSYLPEVDFSIQGLDSNLSWDSSLRLARKLSVPVEVEFEWLHKEGAAHPGKKGRLAWAPASG